MCHFAGNYMCRMAVRTAATAAAAAGSLSGPPSGSGWKYDDSRATHGNVSRVFFAAFSDGCAGKGIVLPFAGLRLKKRGEYLE